MIFAVLLSRYFLRVTVVKRLSDQVEELELITHTLSVFPEMNNRYRKGDRKERKGGRKNERLEGR